jgi:hypothetical protein
VGFKYEKTAVSGSLIICIILFSGDMALPVPGYYEWEDFMSESKKDQGLYTLNEAAEVLPWSVETIRVYRARHDLGRWENGRWYLDESEIEFLRSRQGMRGKSNVVA